MKKLALITLSSLLAFVLLPSIGLAKIVENTSTISTPDSAVEDPADADQNGADEFDANELEGKNPNENSVEKEVRAFISNVSYLDTSGAALVCSEATEVTASENEWTSGWYVVYGTVDATERFVVKGDVKLILANGCTLNAAKGITVSNENSLTIYAQSMVKEQAGTLNARGSWSAGIGGYAIDRDDPERNCGSVTINGGIVSAQGSSACAGIGGAGWGNAYFASCGNCGSVTINGGWVTAYGAGKMLKATAAAAIGNPGGGSGGTITITDGTVTVEPSGVLAAGIGGGANNYVDSIVVSGGHIIANVNTSASSDNQNPCIGNTRSFSTGPNGTAFIETNDRDFKGNTWGFESGTVLNDGDYYVRGDQILSEDMTVENSKELQLCSPASLTIPAGVTLTNNGIIKSNANTTLVVDGHLVNNGTIDNGGGFITGTGTLVGDKASARKPPVPTAQAIGATSMVLNTLEDAGYGAVEYTCVQSNAVPDASTAWQSSPTFASLDPNTEYAFYARYTGNAFYNEAVSDKASLTTENYRVFYVDAGGTKVRTPADVNVVRLSPSYLANSSNELASGWYVVEEDMVIDTARIRLQEGADVHLVLADGIQMSCARGITVPRSSSLSIYGQSVDNATAGMILATGPDGRAAIGGDGLYTCGAISINSGIVMARGGDGAAGIGAGRLQRVGTIEINGGFVRAFGGNEGCAIGGGTNSSMGFISINGGTIEAVGKNAPAIGSAGKYAQNVRVAISGGTLRLGSSGGAPIIGGSQGAKVSFAMKGGLVYGFGDASAMTTCESFEMTGGAMVFAANGAENAPMTNHELTTNDPATVIVAAFMQGIQVPVSTTITDDPTITLPANDQASFTSTKGEQVIITAAQTPDPMRFRVEDGVGDIFLPAGFVATIGDAEPVVSPESGMWLAADGSIEKSDDGSEDNPGGDSSGGDEGEGDNSSNDDQNDESNSGSADDSNSSSEDSNNVADSKTDKAAANEGDGLASYLASTGDAMVLMLIAFIALALGSGVVARRFTGIRAPKQGKHARR